MQAIAPQLVAPCGMNCAICSGYLAYKNHSRFKGKCHIVGAADRETSNAR